MLKNDLSNIWRVRNPLMKRYTWRQQHPLIQRRVDFWLTSNSLQDDIEKTDILTSIKTDHSAITLNIDSIRQYNHGPSFWKLTKSLLDDEQYIKLIEQQVPVWLEEIKYSDNVRVQQDWLKNNIRKETIQYSKDRSKKWHNRVTEIEKKKLRIAKEKLAEEISAHAQSVDTQIEIDVFVVVSLCIYHI